MYLRDIHAEKDLKILRQLIRDHNLGLFTTTIDSDKYPLIQASHIPWVLDIDDEDSETELGTLRGHIARANPQSKAIVESLTANLNGDNVLERDVFIMFNSPHSHYVTAKFFTETKGDTGKVVPTWNYAAVQIYGKAKIYHDSKAPETSAWLQSQVEALSHHNETTTMGYTGGDAPVAWKVSDAPDKYIEIMKKGIVGIEIKIEHMGGKFKMSQEMGKGDRDGVVRGFGRINTEAAQAISKIVSERSEAREALKAK